MEHTLNNLRYVINCYIIGKNRKKYFNDYYSYMKETLPIKGNSIKLDVVVDHYMDHLLVNKRTWDTLYLEKDLKSNLQKIINTFTNNKQFYDDKEITYKTGILLYGPPGSGKSTIAKIIASSLNWNVVYISPAAQYLPLHDMRNTVILIEDIDCFSLENRDQGTEKKNAFLSLHTLLNYIDGTVSPTNCIFIATTNYIQKIDSALLRPGRFDHVLEIPYMSKELAKEMVKDESINIDDIEFPCSPAVIQNRILSNL